MVAIRFRTAEEFATTAWSGIGLAIGMTHAPTLQTHVGVVHRGHQGPALLLNLARHSDLRNDKLPDPDQHYVCVEIDLDPDRASAVTALCRRIWRRHPAIPYGVLYQGGKFAKDGRLLLRDRELGLTCATFVLAVLEGAGLALVKFEDWPARAEDQIWHSRVVAWLRADHDERPEVVSLSHVRGVASELGCARLRPEEVAAAGSHPVFDWPVTFHDASAAGVRLKSGFLCAELLTYLFAWAFV